MSTKKDFEELKKSAVKQGWRIESTKNGHLKWMSPTGELVISESTGSDYRGIKNHLSRLRRAGYKG